MRIRIYMQDKSRLDLEAMSYHVDPRNGVLSIYTQNAQGTPEAIVVYAAGVWRSVMDVGALKKAIEGLNENPRRGSEEVPGPEQAA